MIRSKTLSTAVLTLTVSTLFALPAFAGGTETPAMAETAITSIEITVTDRGYEPATIELTAGEAVRLAFLNQAKSSCAASIQSAGLGIEETALPPGEVTVVELTPDASGEHSFACGMGMLQGTVIVAAG